MSPAQWKGILRPISLVLLAALLPVLCTAWAGAVSTRAVIGIFDELAPYQFPGEDGSFDGIHRDLLDRFAADSQDTIGYAVFESESDAMAALERGEIDAVLSPSGQSDPELAAWTTEPLTQMTLCAVCRADLVRSEEPMDFSGMVAAFEFGAVKYAYLDKLGVRSYLAEGSQSQALDAVRTGKADLVIGPRDCILYHLAGGGEDYVIVKSYLGEIDYCLTVRPGNSAMLRWLEEKVIHLRTSGDYDAVYGRWAAMWTEDDSAIQARVVRWLGLALGVAFFAGLLFAIFSLALKRQLHRMTAALHETNEELQRQLDNIRRESATRQRIIDASNQCILLFTRDGRITMRNEEAARAAGGDAAADDIRELAPFNEIAAPFLGPGTDELLPQGRVYHVAKDGGTALWKSTIVPLPGGDSEALMLTAEDITEEEAQKQKLFEAEKSTTINRVVAGIAHEIRNPLMTIRTFADMIREESGDEEFQKAFYEIVPGEVDRIHALVDRFINYAKPSDAAQTVVDAGRLIRDCLYLTNPVGKRSAIRFDVAIEEDLPVRVSENQIKQVIINIIINGIEAMERRLRQQGPERKLVMEIRAFSRDGEAVISVRDEGVGMTPEALEQCRTPYFTTKPTGIGLGLAVSNELVQLNGGTMTIESREGDHTTISIAFAKEGTD